MRNPERIAEILSKIEAIWTKYPDQRLGQILVNAAPAFESNPYYYEDDDLLECLKKEVEASPDPYRDCGDPECDDPRHVGEASR